MHADLATKIKAAQVQLADALALAQTAATPATVPAPTPVIATAPALPDNNEWQEVKRNRDKSAPLRLRAQPIAIKAAHGSAGGTPAYVYAVRAPTFDKIPYGQLCYVESCKHFALRLGPTEAPILLHGGIGAVYNGVRSGNGGSGNGTAETEQIVKVKNCKFGPTCARAECNYYHDPAVQPSTDIRAYTRHAGPIVDYTALALLPADDFSRVKDQVMHDLLCVLAAESLRARAGD